MPFFRTAHQLPVRVGICLVASVIVLPVEATNFEWQQSNGCGLFSCDFFNPIYWSPAGGPPGFDDFATIDMTGSVHLTQDTQTLDNLTLQSSTSLRTFDNRLNVHGTPGNLFMFGSGFNGSTVLRVDEGGGFKVQAETISLHQGAQLALQGGRIRARFRMLTSQSSLVSGHGGIVADADGIGAVVQFAGTVRPNSGDLSISVTDLGSTHDLDGNVGGDEPGALDVTSTGDLYVSGKQADPFSGRIDIGNGRMMYANMPWDIDGDLTFESVGDNRLAGPSFSFLSGAEVTTNQSTGRVEGASTWASGVTVNLMGGADVLALAGDSEILTGADFLGDGKLVNAGASTMSLRNGASVGVELQNQGVVRVGSSAGAATLGALINEAGGTLRIELAGVGANEFDRLHVLGDAQLGGELDVALLGGFVLDADQRFTILEVDGASSGQFSGLPDGAQIGAPGEGLFITYAGGDGNDVELFTTSTGLAGDFDFDDDVDGADFMKWQRAESPNPLSQTELAEWESNYGTVANPASTLAATVPEPINLELVVSAVGLLFMQFRRNRRLCC